MGSVSKLVMYLALANAMGICAQADDDHFRGRPPHGPPPLTDEQKSCLTENGLPPPEEGGARPTKSQVETAFQACGIPAPPPPPQEGDADARAPSSVGAGTVQ